MIHADAHRDWGRPGIMLYGATPLPADHAFWAHPQVTLLPHVAALTDERSASAVVAANIRALADGAPLAHLVRREAGY